MIEIAIIDDVYREIENIIAILKSDNECSYKYFGNPQDEELIRWIIGQKNPVVVLLDLFFDGEELGETLFKKINQVSPDIPVFIFTSTEDFTTRQKYMEMGCYDYIVKMSVRIQDGPALLQRIKKASQTGFKFHKEFSRIREIWNSDQAKAIFELDHLLATHQQLNLMALKEMDTWIKRYLEKGMENLTIAVPQLLLALDRNCDKILQLQGYEQVDVKLDKSFALLHVGRQAEAEYLLKDMVGLVADAGRQSRRVLNFAMALSSFKNRRRSDAQDIFSLLGINLPSTGYERVLEWLHDYNPDLWNQAINDYFDYWKTATSIEANRILSLFSEDSNAHTLEAYLLKERNAELLRFLYRTLECIIKGVLNQDCDVTALFNCCKYVFQRAQEEWSVMSDCDSVCRNLNELSYFFYINSQSMDWIRFVDAQIANIGTTDEGVVRDVLSRPGKDNRERVGNLHQFIEHFLDKGEKTKATEIVKEYEATIFDTIAGELYVSTKTLSTTSYQLFRLGELFEKHDDARTAGVYFEKAVQGFLNEADRPEFSKSRNEILIYIQEAIRRLKNSGIEIEGYLANYVRLSRENVRIPLPLDNMRIAIAGGHDDFKENVKLLQGIFGGEFIYWGREEKEMKNLSGSILSGGVDIVIYVTGYAGHSVGNIIIPAIDKYNQIQNNRVKLIQLPTNVRAISGVIAYLKSVLGDGTLVKT